MALRKLFTKRLFDRPKTTKPFEGEILSSKCLHRTVAPRHANFPREYLTSPAGSFFRRFILRGAVYHSGPARLPDFLSLPVGEKLREKLKGINNVVGERLNVAPVPVAVPVPAPRAGLPVLGGGLSVGDARKVLKAWRMEKVKATLRSVAESSVSHSEFLRICIECCEDHDQGVELAKILDNSGNVIVLGNVVFLRPEQVAKSIESIIYESIAHPNDPRRKELEEMEKQKSMIDAKAKAQVKAELYCGLGFLTTQTIGFMRLTFWELSWDVMEPICFFVASFHFALAYLFFLRTSTEPTFQGYFFRRFKTKQERLIKKLNFDTRRYNELCKACYLPKPQHPEEHR